jgi:hypothetical protein
VLTIHDGFLCNSVVPNVAINDRSDLSALTVRQLLSHQSGLYDYLVVDGPTEDAALSQYLKPRFCRRRIFHGSSGFVLQLLEPGLLLGGPSSRAGGQWEVIADGDFSDGMSTSDATGGGQASVASLFLG